jgi:septum formation topological specificity factor MinE
VEFFTTFYGPTNRAAAALPADRAAELKAEMLDVVKRFNVADDETLVLRMDYLEAVIHKPSTTKLG